MGSFDYFAGDPIRGGFLMAGQDESKQMAILSAANLADHALDLNTENTKELTKIVTQQESIIVPRREAYLAVCGVVRKIIILTTANDEASYNLALALNELEEEIEDDPELYYYPLARQLWLRVLKRINIAIQKAGSTKEQQFMKVLYSSLSNINFAREKVTIPKIIRNLGKNQE